MAIKGIKKKANQEQIVTKKTKKQPNWILRVTLLVILIPVVIIAFVLLTSMERSGEPVVGKRFKGQLVNEITDDNIKEIEESLQFGNADKVTVNLKSATLRITIDANDGIDRAGLEALANEAYAKVTSILPVETYFTNLTEDDKTIKMYDLEINAYNYIPDESKTEQLYIVISKNAPSEETVTTWFSDVKNEEVRNSLVGQ